MAKKTEEGARKRKPRKAAPKRKATTRRTARAKEEVIEPEDIEIVDDGEATDHDNDDAHDDIEIEVEFGSGPRRRRRAYRREFDGEKLFGADGVFGPDGPFGNSGPFGAGGPFGVQGLFGPGGLFGQGGKRGGRRGGRRAHGGPGRKRERMFRPGELRLVLLAMLAEEPRHGYELIKALEEMTDGVYSPSPGIIYPTLQMLNDEAVIATHESEDARKLYQATDAGLAELEERADELAELWERLGRKAKRARPTGSTELFRSLGNLATVITNRASNNGINSVEKEKVIDLIDELARRIERL